MKQLKNIPIDSNNIFGDIKNNLHRQFIKINEIIEYINKKEEIIVTIPEGEYNIWGNNPEIQKDYISKKELKEWLEENKVGFSKMLYLDDFVEHFKL